MSQVYVESKNQFKEISKGLSESAAAIFNQKIYGIMLFSYSFGFFLNYFVPSIQFQNIILISFLISITASIPFLCNYNPLDPTSILTSNPNCDMGSSSASLHPNFFMVATAISLIGYLHGVQFFPRPGRNVKYAACYGICVFLPLLIMYLWPGGKEDLKGMKEMSLWDWFRAIVL